MTVPSNRELASKTLGQAAAELNQMPQGRGRKSATVVGFNYSGPMKAANITWTEDNLAKWAAGPAKMVPGTKMAFGGIAQKSQIADLVEYLETLK